MKRASGKERTFTNIWQVSWPLHGCSLLLFTGLRFHTLSFSSLTFSPPELHLSKAGGSEKKVNAARRNKEAAKEPVKPRKVLSESLK